MTSTEANAVYEVLVRECAAPEAYRADFVRAFTSERPPIEWRFCGALGFGGKFYPVTCYPEDETLKRRKMVQRANEALRRMVERSG